MTMRAAAETTAKMMGQEGVHLTINKVLRWWIAEDGGWGERKRWCGDCGDGRTTPTTKAVASSKHANDICAVVGSLSSAVLSDRGGGRMLAIVQNPGEGGGGGGDNHQDQGTVSPTTPCTTTGRTSRRVVPKSRGSSSCGGRSA